MTPLLLSSHTATTCLGRGRDALLAGLRAGRSGLAPCAFETVKLDTWIGEVAAVDAEKLPDSLARYDCRNNRLVRLGLEADGFADAVRAATARYGRARVGVFLGTSTAGILQTELAYRRRDPDTGALPDDFIYRTTHNRSRWQSSHASISGWKGRRWSFPPPVRRAPRCSPHPPANWPAAPSTRRSSAASIPCA